MNLTIGRLTAALANRHRIERDLSPDRFLNDAHTGTAGVGRPAR